MHGHYRTAVLTGPGSMALESRPLPDLQPRQVRIRLEGCGVCGSNLPVWEGRPWFSYPFPAGAPGHEGWGRVEAVGGEVSDLKVGDRVTVLSYHAFAEVDTADAGQMARLPPEVDGQPFPGEALGCAFNILRRADIQPHHRVAIVGIGFLGALLTRLVAQTGAQVLAISRRPFALEMARRMGAAHTWSFDGNGRIVEDIKALSEGRGCDRVIEATGLQKPLDLAGELTAERGRLIVAGYHQDGPRQINMQLWNWRGIDVVNAHERDMAVYMDGIREAIAAVAAGRLDPRPLYTHRFKLDELPDAFACMQQRNEPFLKSWVAYD